MLQRRREADASAFAAGELVGMVPAGVPIGGGATMSTGGDAMLA